MKIDENTLQNLEKLAKLSVDAQAREVTIDKLVRVLEMLDKVDMDDIADLEPLYHPLEISQALRDDIADKRIDREALQAGAPLVEKGLFLVPKVIE